MTRQVFDFGTPDRVVIGTVGMPGERTFFLQARKGNQVTSVVLEKQQALVLAERIDVLLDHVRDNGSSETPVPDAASTIDSGPLDAPIVEEFRVGSMSLGWDEASDRVIVEAHAVTDDDDEELPDLADDEADGSDTVRVWMPPQQARNFAARAKAVVAAGRPACPFCAQPLDPDGHVCPRANGYRRRG